MEINVKEHNLKEQFKERMIQQNNMEIIAKRLVDNDIKNTVEEVKNEKTSEKNYPRLAKQLTKMAILQKILNCFIKMFFLSPSRIRKSERITKKNACDK